MGSDEPRVEVGQVYEAWSAAPGYPPMRWRVTSMADQGWCWVTDLHSPAANVSPMRQSTLLTPKLYHRIAEDSSARHLDPSGGTMLEVAAAQLRYALESNELTPATRTTLTTAQNALNRVCRNCAGEHWEDAESDYDGGRRCARPGCKQAFASEGEATDGD